MMDFRQGVPSRGWLFALAWAVVGAMSAGAQDDPNLRIGPTAPSPQLAPMQTEEKTEGAFGPGTQAFLVMAPEFVPFDSGAPGLVYKAFHYYSNDSVDPRLYFAPVLLPAGAFVQAIQCYVSDASMAHDVHFELQNYFHDLGTNVPGSSILATWSSSGFSGYQYTGASLLNHTVRYLDGDRSYVYYLSADLASDTALRECRIYWTRSVSPAPASATFGDVPTDYIYFRAIEALAAAGITAGCPGGNFCPGQNVTRGEFAAFLARALGLHWPK